MIYVVTFTEQDTAMLDRLAAISSPWRQARAASIRPAEGRLRCLAAGLLLDYALKAEGCAPIVEVSFGPHGKPGAEGVSFSLTHCRGLAACIVDSRPVGIDAEPLRAFPDRLRRRAFTEAELADAETNPEPDHYLTGLWTLKESLLKARGIGIAEGPRNFAFRVRDGAIEGPPGYSYTLYEDLPGYRIATAIQTGPEKPLV